VYPLHRFRLPTAPMRTQSAGTPSSARVRARSAALYASGMSLWVSTAEYSTQVLSRSRLLPAVRDCLSPSPCTITRADRRVISGTRSRLTGPGGWSL